MITNLTIQIIQVKLIVIKNINLFKKKTSIYKCKKIIILNNNKILHMDNIITIRIRICDLHNYLK